MLSGVVSILALLYFASPKTSLHIGPTPAARVAANIRESPSVTVGLPVRLRIPAINVDASIEQLGLTSAGAMDATKGPSDVAWYKYGPRPGATGSAVIDGHFGWSKGIPAVFDNISKLHPGDKLIVVDERGVSTTFAVRELRKYRETADTETVFASSDGRAHLNLITCAGIYNSKIGRFPDRLVVFADE